MSTHLFPSAVNIKDNVIIIYIIWDVDKQDKFAR